MPKGEIMRCTSCDTPGILYWVTDDVWRQLRDASVGEHLCVQCAEEKLGRAFTLDDLEIRNYKRTAKNMGHIPDFMKQYVRSTILGACQATNGPTPEGWQIPNAQPHIDAMTIGEHLAQQTANSQQLLPGLILEAERLFP